MQSWECLTCARVVDLDAEDYCPVCGAELPNPVFTHCNVCGIALRTCDEDEMGMCEKCAGE